MKLKILDFIKNNADWVEKISQPPYNIIIKRKDNFILLKYNQINSDMSNPIVQECRGLILKEYNGEYNVASMRFIKFFNCDEPKAALLDFSAPVVVSQKIDGSLIGIWFDKETGWHISTSGNIDAEDAPISFQTDKFTTYKDLFLEACKNEGWYNSSKEDFNLDKAYTWIFELVSPYNRIIVPYKETKLYLLGIRNNKTFEEVGFWYIKGNFNKPKYFLCKDITDARTAAGKLTMDDEHFEGFVLCDRNYNRIKLKSAKYLDLFMIKGDGIFSEKKILKIILDEQDDDVIEYFPEYEPDFDRIKSAFKNYLEAIRKDLYLIAIIYPCDRKTFAEWAKNASNPAIMFKAYDLGKWNEEWLMEKIKSISLDNLLIYIKKENEINE